MVTGSLVIFLFGGISLAQTNGDRPGWQPPQADEQINSSGEPIVAGQVSTINDNFIAITNEGNIPYDVNFSKAIIVKGNVSGSASDIALGDYLLVQGAFNGTSVAASLVIDQTVVGETASSTRNKMIILPTEPNNSISFWGLIGRFFRYFLNFF
jgi:hypothetical protein